MAKQQHHKPHFLNAIPSESAFNLRVW